MDNQLLINANQTPDLISFETLLSRWFGRTLAVSLLFLIGGFFFSILMNDSVMALFGLCSGVGLFIVGFACLDYYLLKKQKTNWSVSLNQAVIFKIIWLIGVVVLFLSTIGFSQIDSFAFDSNGWSRVLIWIGLPELLSIEAFDKIFGFYRFGFVSHLGYGFGDFLTTFGLTVLTGLGTAGFVLVTTCIFTAIKLLRKQ